MIYHILINHRHTVTFLSNASSFFDPTKHRFFVVDGMVQAYDWSNEMAAVSDSLKFTQLNGIGPGDCIVLHSLFMPSDFLKKILSLKAQLKVHIVWSSWGSDFLNVMQKQLQDVPQFFDCVIVNRSAFQAINFPRNILVDNDTKFYLDPREEVPKGKTKDTILLGNSGDPSNNHFEILEKIDTSTKVIIPLNYNCPKKYRDDLQNWLRGKDNISPIDTILDSSSYRNLLEGVKLSIYAHDRQQGIHTARTVYTLGGNVCLKKFITDAADNYILNPGYVALSEIGCPDLIDFDQIDRFTDDFIENLKSPRKADMFTTKWQRFYFEAFESRWS